MRESFHADLADLRTLVATMCEHAATAMRQATDALLSADRDVAEQVLAADAALDGMRDQCEERAQQMLALQAPVATDLRVVLSAIYCAEKIERMGDLAEHIASTTCRVHPHHVVPPELRDTFGKLGTVTADMAAKLVTHLTDPCPGAFAELEATDHTVDELHAQVLATVTANPSSTTSPPPRHWPWWPASTNATRTRPSRPRNASSSSAPAQRRRPGRLEPGTKISELSTGAGRAPHHVGNPR